MTTATSDPAPYVTASLRWRAGCAICTLLLGLGGCLGGPESEDGFHTSGNREADQRAEQRITATRQMRGEDAAVGDEAPEQSLYGRLGGAEGVRRIVADFVDRALADPRVNWARKGVLSGGVLGVGQSSEEWTPSARHVTALREHLAQFIAVATGGPSDYDGRQLDAVHAGMEIRNTEFDAAIGDLKASMDALHVEAAAQKELLAIFESTRPQIVEDQ